MHGSRPKKEERKAGGWIMSEIDDIVQMVKERTESNPTMTLRDVMGKLGITEMDIAEKCEIVQ
jgi:predicted DNA-binding transcriptional regulator AlpA